MSQGRVWLTGGAHGPGRASWAICPTSTNPGTTTSSFNGMTRRITRLGFQFGLFWVKRGISAAGNNFWPKQAQTSRAQTPITATCCGRALQLTGDTPAPQGAHRKGAKETGLRTHSAPGDPQATKPGCGRAGKRKFHPSQSHKGRTARWRDP